MAGNQNPCTIPEAIEQALIEMGTQILEQPESLVSQIRPLIGDGPIENALLKNCSAQLLAPFGAAVASGGTAEALQDAAVKAADVLTAQGVDADLAETIGGQVMAGVARALNAEAPIQRGSSAPKTTPAASAKRPDAPASSPQAPSGARAAASQAPAGRPATPTGAPSTPQGAPSAPDAAPTETSASASQPKDTGKRKVPLVPIIAGVAAVILVVVLVFLFIPKRATIAFEGGAEAQGNTEPIEATAGETITLPENGFVRDGYEFVGWIPTSEQDGETLAPGTQVSADDASSYTAAWQIMFTFDGNGADGGETAPISGKEYSDVTLPECGFMRKGYLFAGWTTNKDDGFGFGALQPGDTYVAGAPTTFYATWVTGSPVMEVSVKELDKAVTGDIGNWDGAVGNCGLVVTNDTGKPVQLNAEFAFTPAAGGEDYKTSDFITYLGPGEKTLLVGLYADDASKATYSVKADNPFDFAKAAGGHISAEVDEISPNHVALVIGNTDADKIELQGVPCLLTDPDGNHFIAIPDATTTLEKGKSTKVVFDEDALLNHHIRINWEDCDREYFIKAYDSTI